MLVKKVSVIETLACLLQGLVKVFYLPVCFQEPPQGMFSGFSYFKPQGGNFTTSRASLFPGGFCPSVLRKHLLLGPCSPALPSPLPLEGACSSLKARNRAAFVFPGGASQADLAAAPTEGLLSKSYLERAAVVLGTRGRRAAALTAWHAHCSRLQVRPKLPGREIALAGCLGSNPALTHSAPGPTRHSRSRVASLGWQVPAPGLGREG